MNLVHKSLLLNNPQKLWWNGPTWLCDPEMWLENPVTVKTEASEREARVIREVLSLAKEEPKQQPNVFDELLKHFDPENSRAVPSVLTSGCPFNKKTSAKNPR